MSDRRLNNVERTYIQEEQPNKFHCYIQSMGLVDRMDQTLAKFITGICMKEWWCSPFALMVDAIFQNERMLYSKRCCQCNFSEIFKERQIILEPCSSLKCHNTNFFAVDFDFFKDVFLIGSIFFFHLAR